MRTPKKKKNKRLGLSCRNCSFVVVAVAREEEEYDEQDSLVVTSSQVKSTMWPKDETSFFGKWATEKERSVCLSVCRSAPVVLAEKEVRRRRRARGLSV
jgi:hypothetical protein